MPQNPSLTRRVEMKTATLETSDRRPLSSDLCLLLAMWDEGGCRQAATIRLATQMAENLNDAIQMRHSRTVSIQEIIESILALFKVFFLVLNFIR